jgi:2-succinyl-6-hydroxy-2,4-cyclohexadiene-1-carboxylate synthase
MAPSQVLHITPLDEGPATARCLVLVHGFTGDSTTWAPLLPHLGPDRPVWGLDLVGHGRSAAPVDPSAYTMRACLQAIRDTIEPRGLAPAHWLGYSMGGRVVLNLALEHPRLVASLSLIGASPGIDDPAARAERLRADADLADVIERDGLAAFVDGWMAQPLFRTQQRLGEDFLHRARAQRLRNRPHALALTLRGLGTGVMEPLGPRLGSVAAPVLLITGALDAKLTVLAGRMAEVLPRAGAVVVPDAGHAAHLEAPEAVGAAVRDFLRSLDGR